MPPSNPIPDHIKCLTKAAISLKTKAGEPIDVWELASPIDDKVLAAWAAHFRQHYCLDSELDSLRNGTGLSRKDYLCQLVFPDNAKAPGPAIRAGDFAEILISDYLQHIAGAWVPRGKFRGKAVRNESVKGVDILGFHVVVPGKQSPNDVLTTFEVKASLTGTKYGGHLQQAIDDSSKDVLRRAETLNATKRRLLAANEKAQALVVQRFQNITDHPYIHHSGAAAVLVDEAFDKQSIVDTTDTVAHVNRKQLKLLAVRGSDLMKLVHALYQKAADDA